MARGRRRAAPAVAVLSLLPALLLASCGSNAPSPATATATATATAIPGPPAASEAAFLPPDADRALAHIQVLAVEIGVRASTTEGERRAAEYIAARLEEAGYRVEIESFSVDAPMDRSTVLLPSGEALPGLALEGSPSASATGRLVDGGLGRAQDLATVDARGAVLLLLRGEVTFGDKVRQAVAAGAVAVVVANNRPGLFRGSLDGLAPDIPAVAVSQQQGATLAGLAAALEPVTVEAAAGAVSGESRNVFGRAGEGGCDAYLGAHYDSVPASPGANDNASGTAVLIELARTHRVVGLCVVAFGSEETGLHGSRAFVQSHDVSGARFMLNLDMLGKVIAPEFIASDGIASSRALAGSAARGAAAQGFEVPQGVFPQYASSDHASFAAAGVPAVTVYSGEDPAMHTAADGIDNVSRDDLAFMLQLSAAALRALLLE